MPSILIIDDDDCLREMLAAALTKFGYTVRQARDGSKGIADFRAEPVDLVMTDLIMPNKEGIATITELRREAPSLPIIAMSGSVHTSIYFKLAVLLGATVTLQKPFDFSELRTAIAAALGEGSGAANSSQVPPPDPA